MLDFIGRKHPFTSQQKAKGLGAKRGTEIAEKMISNSAKEKRETSNKQKWTFAMAKQSVLLIFLHEGVFYGNNKEL